MKASIRSIEKQVFRRVNALVEPLVLSGRVSSGRLPLSLIVLETRGFKSGQQRRTPLWSVRIGDYRLVSTARGRRSFWTRNLAEQPRVRFFLGGKPKEAEAILVTPDFDNIDGWDLNFTLSRLVAFLARLAGEGWAFALLVPAEDARA
jgi:deazaflavin-dependent oxidoreductase (nitroreductase family)